MTYDWQAALAFVATLVVMTTLGSKLLLQVPAVQRMRRLNREADRPKLARESFKQAVETNSRIGLGTNLVFYVTILPFCVNLEPRPIWVCLVEIAAVLMIFDFFYYLTRCCIEHVDWPFLCSTQSVSKIPHGNRRRQGPCASSAACRDP